MHSPIKTNALQYNINTKS